MTRKPALKRKSAKKAKPRLVEHRTLGVCTLRRIRALDSNDLVAVVEFSDGTERAIRLDERFWLTRITEIMQAPLEPARKHKAETKAAEPEAVEPDDEADEPELVPGDDGHLRDGDAPEDEDEEDA